MSFFTGDVTAKEQLHGVVGTAAAPPPPAPAISVPRGFAVKRRIPVLLGVNGRGELSVSLVLHKLMVGITSNGEVTVHMPVNKDYGKNA